MPEPLNALNLELFGTYQTSMDPELTTSMDNKILVLAIFHLYGQQTFIYKKLVWRSKSSTKKFIRLIFYSKIFCLYETVYFWDLDLSLEEFPVARISVMMGHPLASLINLNICHSL